jgi:hypothetical protein|tara:strand:- start:81 stop:500 length:420 start_codon:yes stop_codon:yes gene_type:complete
MKNTKNNIDKALEAKDGKSLAQDIEKLEFDVRQDILDTLKDMYQKEKTKGQSFIDWLKSKPSEELKQIKLAKGGIIKDPTYTYYDEGGPVKPPVKDEIEVKKIDLDSELSKLGNFFLRMNNRDRATVIDLLKKSGVIKD